jgi:MFS family permease
LFGLTFGVLDVSFPTFARTHGSAGTAGVLLSAFAAGSWVGGLLYGLRPRRTAAGRLYPRLSLLAAAGLLPLILTPSLPVMGVLSTLGGLCFAPITNLLLAIVEEVVSAGHRAEAFTWVGSFYGAGLALGAAIAGQIISGQGIRTALALAAGATLVAWLIASARASTLMMSAGTAAMTRPPRWRS